MTDEQIKQICNSIHNNIGIAVFCIGFMLALILFRVNSFAHQYNEVTAFEQSIDLPQTLTLDSDLAQQPNKPRYHIVDDTGMQTFTPQENVICYWIDIKRAEGHGSRGYPIMITRSSGLSCLYVSDKDYESYLDRYPR